MATIDLTMQYLGLAIAAVTNIGCIYIVAVTTYWWFKLKNTATQFRPFILAVAFAKTGIWLWTFTQILHVVIYDNTLPLITLAPRLMLMAAVFLQIYVIQRYRGHRDDGL
jgi:hypothetical protein